MKNYSQDEISIQINMNEFSSVFLLYDKVLFVDYQKVNNVVNSCEFINFSSISFITSGIYWVFSMWSVQYYFSTCLSSMYNFYDTINLTKMFWNSENAFIHCVKCHVDFYTWLEKIE